MIDIAIDTTYRPEKTNDICSECNNSGVYVIENAYDASYVQPVICSCSFGQKVLKAFNFDDTKASKVEIEK